MNNPQSSFQRQANPLPMVFRLAFLYSLYVFPVWFIIRDFSIGSIPGLLGAFFSTIIVLIVILIRIRKTINGRTERKVNTIDPSDGLNETSITQSFTFRDYLGLNAEVMFSYLRPYLSILGGLLFLAVFGISFRLEYGIVKTGLAFALALYLLTIPWMFFLVKTRRVYLRSKPYLENQVLTVTGGTISVQAGPSAERRFESLDDIAITRNYLLLFIAGSNYLQIQRQQLDNSGEANILCNARSMVLAKVSSEA